MSEVKDVLLGLGYKLQSDGQGWRAKPIYRDGNNPTSLKIYPDGGWCDFAEGISGNLQKLVLITLGLKNYEDAAKWLNDKQFIFNKAIEEKPKVIMAKTFDPSILNKLIKNHEYWNKRGISDKTLNTFKIGVAVEGKMAGRTVIPIFDNEYDKIIGFCGRDITGKKENKYKLVNPKKDWFWPYHINKEDILKEKSVILVESPACVLSLYENGIKNAICLWGINISDHVICCLCGLNLKSIIISTNNEPDNDGVGNRAAIEIKKKLLNFFDESTVKIILPTSKDFSDMSPQDIQDWHKNLKNI